MARTGSLLLALLAAAGCVSEQKVLRASYEVERELVSEIGVVSSPELGPYLADVAGRLSPSGQAPEIRVLDVDGELGFVLPNGTVFLSRGMLAVLNSDAELAMLLAHELAHRDAGHAMRGIRRSSLVHFLALLATPLMIFTGPPDRFASGVTRTVMPSYSRAQERAADRRGMESVARAGIDAGCAARLYLTLARLEARREQAARGFFATHPPPEDRYRSVIDEAEPDARACPSGGFVERLSGLALLRSDLGAYRDASGRLVLVGIFAALSGAAAEQGEFAKVDSRSYGGWLASPPAELSIRRHRSDLGLDWARRQAGAWRAGALLHEELRAGPHASVRVAFPLDEGSGRHVRYYHWLVAGGRLYQIDASVREQDWSAAEPLLYELASGLAPVPAAEFAELGLLPRLGVHVAADGDSLASLAERYPGNAPEQLAFYNGLAPGAELAPGQPVKVLVYSPLPADRRPHDFGARPPPWERAPAPEASEPDSP